MSHLILLIFNTVTVVTLGFYGMWSPTQLLKIILSVVSHLFLPSFLKGVVTSFGRKSPRIIAFSMSVAIRGGGVGQIMINQSSFLHWKSHSLQRWPKFVTFPTHRFCRFEMSPTDIPSTAQPEKKRGQPIHWDLSTLAKQWEKEADPNFLLFTSAFWKKNITASHRGDRIKRQTLWATSWWKLGRYKWIRGE